MRILSSFKTGITTTGQYWRMILLLFIINIAAALLLTMPLRGFLVQTIGNSLAADEIAWNNSFLYGSDLSINYLDAFQTSISGSFIAIAVVLYLLLTTFLAGGVLGTFDSGEKFSFKGFFGYSGTYFWAFLRLLLITLLFFVIIVLIYMGIGKGFSGLMEDSPNEPLVFALFVIQQAIFLFLFFFLDMVFDYAKIRAVIKGERSMWRVAFGSFGFVFRNIGRTFGLYYLIGIVAVLFFAAYFSIAHYAIPTTSVIFLFLWQQLYQFA